MNRTDKKVCPRCDGQGLIRHIRIIPLNLEAYLCDECDAFWVKKEEISLETFVDFTTFLESKGLDYNSTEIEFLD